MFIRIPTHLFLQHGQQTGVISTLQVERGVVSNSYLNSMKPQVKRACICELSEWATSNCLSKAVSRHVQKRVVCFVEELEAVSISTGPRNQMVSRVVIYLTIMSLLKLCWIIEQPASSLLECHPLFAWRTVVYKASWCAQAQPVVNLWPAGLPLDGGIWVLAIYSELQLYHQPEPTCGNHCSNT